MIKWAITSSAIIFGITALFIQDLEPRQFNCGYGLDTLEIGLFDIGLIIFLAIWAIMLTHIMKLENQIAKLKIKENENASK